MDEPSQYPYSQFRTDIEVLVKEHSIDTHLNIPAHVIAHFFTDSLKSLHVCVEHRDVWETHLNGGKHLIPID